MMNALLDIIKIRLKINKYQDAILVKNSLMGSSIQLKIFLIRKNKIQIVVMNSNSKMVEK